MKIIQSTLQFGVIFTFFFILPVFLASGNHSGMEEKKNSGQPFAGLPLFFIDM